MAEQQVQARFPHTALDKVLVIFGSALAVSLVLIAALPLVAGLDNPYTGAAQSEALTYWLGGLLLLVILGIARALVFAVKGE